MKTVKHKVYAPLETELNVLPGNFNNLNVEAALDAVSVLGIGRDSALKTLRSFKLPEGRMMSIKNSSGLNIIIDFAHNPSSLDALLNFLKSEKKGKLIAVFGCASERDDSKRPVMGEISTRLADISVFTAEDPRKEDINKIISEMAAGVVDKKINEIDPKYFIDPATNPVKDFRGDTHIYLRIPERGEAISFAIQKLAKKGDTVAILGKGHEKSMAYNGVEYPWSDKKAVDYALKGKILRIDRKI